MGLLLLKKVAPREITFLYWEQCMSHDKAMERLKEVMAELRQDTPIKVIKVETDEQAQPYKFIGSPTILVDGKDIQLPPPDSYYALTCRTYFWDDGRVSPLPSHETIRKALRA
jgi:hypothetical protein